MAGVPKAVAAGTPATKAGTDTVGQIARDAKAHHASTSSSPSSSSPSSSAAPSRKRAPAKKAAPDAQSTTGPAQSGPTRKQSQTTPAPPRRSGAGPSLIAGAGAGAALNQGAGFLLGALLWAWVGLPFLKGGPTQVKAVLMAKLFNKDPKGQALN